MRNRTKRIARTILDSNIVNPNDPTDKNHWSCRKGPWGIDIYNLLVGDEVRAYVIPNRRKFAGQWYWDTKAIILGLLGIDDPGMHTLAMGMVENLFFLQDSLGLIPNASDSAHSTRSQPPFLSSMVLEITNNILSKNSEIKYEFYDWLFNAYMHCKHEYEHTWKMYSTSLNFSWFDKMIFTINTKEPSDVIKMFRPESRSDARIIRGIMVKAGVIPFSNNGNNVSAGDINRFCKVLRSSTAEQRNLLVKWLHSKRLLAASGMDFTASYGLRRLPQALKEIIEPGEVRKEDLIYSAIEDCIPVDLNALLFKYTDDCINILNILNGKGAEPYGADCDLKKDIAYWQEEKNRISNIFDHVLWSENVGRYCNYDLKRKCKNEEFIHLSCLAYPLWAGVPDHEKAIRIASQIESLISNFGVKMSNSKTGYQWDWNMWPLPTWLTIQGLKKFGFHVIADDIKEKYLRCVERVCRDRNSIYEKYNAEDGNLQTDGRYPPEKDFSWGAAIYIALLNN